MGSSGQICYILADSHPASTQPAVPRWITEWLHILCCNSRSKLVLSVLLTAAVTGPAVEALMLSRTSKALFLWTKSLQSLSINRLFLLILTTISFGNFSFGIFMATCFHRNGWVTSFVNSPDGRRIKNQGCFSHGSNGVWWDRLRRYLCLCESADVLNFSLVAGKECLTRSCSNPDGYHCWNL